MTTTLNDYKDHNTPAQTRRIENTPQDGPTMAHAGAERALPDEYVKLLAENEENPITKMTKRLIIRDQFFKLLTRFIMTASTSEIEQLMDILKDMYPDYSKPAGKGG